MVTASFNQGAFIEQTLRSVLDQQYPNLEYIVIDGGSSDGTVNILRRYEAQLAYWVSEPDRGQADAINKGFSRATGDLCAYLNSDDLYEPGCLARVVADFQSWNDQAWHAYPVQDFSTDRLLKVHDAPGMSRKLGAVPSGEDGALANDLLQWVIGRVGLHQPGVFWRREHWATTGGFDIRYQYAFDRQFFMKLISAGYPLVCHRGPPLARFRLHHDSKTGKFFRGVDNPFVREQMEIADEFERELPPDERKIARRVRTVDSISAAWRMFRAGTSRRDCFLWLGRLALSRQAALLSRYFWGSAFRFLVAPRRRRP